MVVVDREALAWAAGFFEGEGSVSLTIKPGRRQASLTMHIGQCDMEPLLRFQAAIGGHGRIYNRKKSLNPHHNPQWTWSTGKFELVQGIIAMLWHWMSARRRLQTGNVLRAYASRPPDRRGWNARPGVRGFQARSA